MADARPSLAGLRLRRVALAALALVLIAASLVISPQPAVRSETRPSSEDLQAARQVWTQMKAAQATGYAARVNLDNQMIKGLASLASDATSIATFKASVSHGVLAGEASIGMPAGLWVNVSATTTGQHDGFPPIRLQIGRLSLPPLPGQWLANFARSILEVNGSSIPPLDSMIQHVAISENEVLAELTLPQDTGIADNVIAGAGEDLNLRLVSSIYCRIANTQEADPATDLAHVVRRSFDQLGMRAAEEHRRAAFVAIALLVAREEAETIAPQTAQLAKNCSRPTDLIQLHQRPDLAKHWTLSAALAARFGKRTATNLGEWKELYDSRPAGSGFSFVDLAADRAGLQMALRALDPASAASTLSRLQRATEEDLLPSPLLQAPEGLTRAEFVETFGSIDHDNYRRAIAIIDDNLARKSH